MQDTSSTIEKWWPVLERGAEKLFKNSYCSNNKLTGLVHFNASAFVKAREKYEEYRGKLHSVVQNGSSPSLIDRHKVIAALVLAFADQDSQIFVFDYDALDTTSLECIPEFIGYPTEYYISSIMMEILTEFVKETKKRVDTNLDFATYGLELPQNVVCWESGKENAYTSHLIDMLVILRQYEDADVKLLFALSHLIFFYELAYDCAVAGLKDVYYPKQKGRLV